MQLPPSCSAKESKLGHISKGSWWGSGCPALGPFPLPLAVVGMIHTPQQGSPWLPVLTQVTGTSQQALSQRLFPALPLQSPLFACLDKTKLSPSQPFSMPIKFCPLLDPSNLTITQSRNKPHPLPADPTAAHIKGDPKL